MSIVNSSSLHFPYSKTVSSNEIQALRTKAFSQTDNLPNPSQDYTYSPIKLNNDRIDQIKKKYEKTSVKSSAQKISNENQRNQRNFFRHSQMKIGNENDKFSNLSKYDLSSSIKKQSYSIEGSFDKNSSSLNQKQYLKRDYSGLKNTEIRSQVDNNRSNLADMKGQLQTRLNDIYKKSSNLKDRLMQGQKNIQTKGSSNQKLSNQEALTYQAIINKYSKSMSSKNRNLSGTINTNAISSLSSIGPEIPLKYTSKYEQKYQSKYSNNTASISYKNYEASKRLQISKQKGQRRQLSVISQISNSNNSQVPRDSDQILLGKSSCNTNCINMPRKQTSLKQNPVYNAESKIIIEKPSEKYSIKRQSSLYSRNQPGNNDEKNEPEQTYQRFYNNLVDKQKIDENLLRQIFLKSSNKQSFSGDIYGSQYSKRPSTSQGFKDRSERQSSYKQSVLQKLFRDEKLNKDSSNYADKYSKYNQKINKYDDEKLTSNFDQKPIKPQGYKPIRQRQLDRENLQFTLNKLENNQINIKRIDNSSNIRQNRSTSVNQPSKYYNQQRSEIEKLKEKYKINTQSKSSNQQSMFQKTPSTTNKNSQARNNQSISKEISRLDQRIRLIEQNKKQLNLKFKPYQMSKSIIKNSQNKNGDQTSKENQTRQRIVSQDYSRYSKCKIASQEKGYQYMNYRPSSSNLKGQQRFYLNYSNQGTINEKSSDNIRNPGYIERVKPLYSQVTLPQAKRADSTPFSIKLMPVQKDSDFQSSEINDKSRTKQYMHRLELQSRTDCGIQERKKRLQEQVQVKNNIKSLVKYFGEQASLDQNFRNNKIWFASLKNNLKWQQLKTQLGQKGHNYSIEQLKRQFKLYQSENNPFFSVNDHKCDIKSLTTTYIQSKRHWDEKISGKYDRSCIEKQGFNNNKIDSDKKGFIQIEDFVRFLNIQSGTFLRNRDLSIIFRRISPNSQKMSYDQLISTVSH